jgi:hypothetical protein
VPALCVGVADARGPTRGAPTSPCAAARRYRRVAQTPFSGVCDLQLSRSTNPFGKSQTSNYEVCASQREERTAGLRMTLEG